MPCTICHNSEKFEFNSLWIIKCVLSKTLKTSFDPFSASCFSSFCSSPKSSNTDVLMNFCNPPSQPTKPNQTKLTNPATGHLVHSIPSSCQDYSNGWLNLPSEFAVTLPLARLWPAFNRLEKRFSPGSFGQWGLFREKKKSKRIHCNSILNV